MKSIFLKREPEALRLRSGHGRIAGNIRARDPIAFAAALEILG